MVEESKLNEMSFEEADKLARDIQLGGPDYVLPDGRTKGQFFRERREEERAALRRGLEGRGVAASQSAERVRVGFTGGQLIMQPVAAAEDDLEDQPRITDPKVVKGEPTPAEPAPAEQTPVQPGSGDQMPSPEQPATQLASSAESSVAASPTARSARRKPADTL
jgi:hypothetical protein